MRELKLRNGSTEPEPVVHATMMHLNAMAGDGHEGLVRIFYLNEIARNRADDLPPEIIKALSDMGILSPNGTMHGSVRNVIVSAISDDGETLHSPVLHNPGANE